jgi:hypothetical protein
MQAIQTAIISTMAGEPSRSKASRACGCNLQMGSRKLPGKASDAADMKLAAVPITNRIVKALMPNGRVFSIVILLGTANSKELKPPACERSF